MNIEALLGRLVRRLNRQLMAFADTSNASSLPAAVNSSYLLYLHVPYCLSLCPFCSFHRVMFDHENATRYFECLRRDIELHEDLGYRFDELYVGGGTPTVLPDELIRTIAELRERHALTSVSVETNPDHLQSDAVRRLSEAGINRLSVGVQSFDDSLLKAMRRYDAYGSGKEIVKRLVKMRGAFDTLNVDMIFNLPNQTESSLVRDLDILIDDVAADQVSFYPLMSSDTTKEQMFRAMGRGDSSREHAYYRMIVERLLGAGYERASAWCFSRRPGMFDEYIVSRDEYVGLGSGAFSYLQGCLYANTFSISHYRQLIRAGASACVSERSLSIRDQMRYYLLMRLFGGTLDKPQAEAKFDGVFQRTLWRELAALRTIRAIRETDNALELTERGYYLWVVLMREFFAGINNLRDQVRNGCALEESAPQSALRN